jgi:hypothetical protein
MLKRIAIGLKSLWLITSSPIASFADDLFIYPTKSQSAERKTRTSGNAVLGRPSRRGSILRRERQLQLHPPSREAPKGGLLRGAAGRAALGALGGAIAGNAGKGAAIGAAGGGLLGLMRRNDQVRQEQYANQQWAQQNIAQQGQNRSSWVRAVKACLTGRGYTVQ